MPSVTLDLQNDPVAALATALSLRLQKARLPACPADKLAGELKELLDGDGAASRDLRLAISIHLVEVANKGPVPAKDKSDPMLTTEEAAKLMGRSRPWVAMLIDSGELPGAEVSRGGHRKVPKSSVLGWMERNKPSQGSADYRKAGRDTGIYEADDALVAKALRESRL
jgi:excisionase family DNA binding protein